MKMKVIFATLAMFAATTAFAQKGVVDGSKYGHGEDSIRCITNISLYVTYCKSGNYRDAAEFWQIVYDECPASSRDLYLWGSRIIGWQIQNEQDATKRAALIDKLMQMYDKRIQYFGNDSRFPTPWILGRKAIDYVVYKTDDQLKKPAYEWMEESINQLGPNSDIYVLQYFLNISFLIFQAEPDHKTKYIDDYLKVTKLMEEIVAAGGNNADAVAKLRSDVDASFASSGAADCETLQNIYGPRVEENKENIEWLREAMSLMNKVKCQETEAFAAASTYAHKIDPSAESAWGCAIQAIKKKDLQLGSELLEDAISRETDNDRKADYYYTLAQVQSEMRRFSAAKANAYKATECREGFGAPYIFIARMIAADLNNIYGDAVLRGAAYNIVLDKLEKAKSVDSTLTESANQLIGSYRAYLPSSEALFMHNEVKKGSTFTVGGWVQERTTIR